MLAEYQHNIQSHTWDYKVDIYSIFFKNFKKGYAAIEIDFGESNLIGEATRLIKLGVYAKEDGGVRLIGWGCTRRISLVILGIKTVSPIGTRRARAMPQQRSACVIGTRNISGRAILWFSFHTKNCVVPNPAPSVALQSFYLSSFIPVNDNKTRLSIMPPQRMRTGFDDSRSEASSTRDKQPAYTGISKGRRNGTSTLAGSNLKDITNAQTTPSGQPKDAAVSVRLCPVG